MARKALDPGTTIGRYKIRTQLYQDAAGITYTGEAIAEGDDRQRVYIREFCPGALTRRRKEGIFPARRAMKDDFDKALAQQTDKFDRVVSIQEKGFICGREKIEANNTVYLVTNWPSGEHLAAVMKRDGAFSPGFTRSLLANLVPALKAIEAAGLVLTELTPERMFRRENGFPLIAFPDRMEVANNTPASECPEFRHTPYTAPEYLEDSEVAPGPVSNVYALAASLFFLITTKPPASAKSRKAALAEGEPDPLRLDDLEERLHDDPILFSALDHSLRLDPTDRLASIAGLETAMSFIAMDVDEDDTEPAAGLSTGKRDKLAPAWWRPAAIAGAVIAIALTATPFVMTMDFSNADEAVAPVMVATPATNPPPEAATVEVSATETSDPFPADSPVNPPAEEDIIPDAVQAWLSVDQTDPSAVLAFYREYEADEQVAPQARARWLTLEADAWTNLGGTPSQEALTGFIETFGMDAPDFARYRAEAAAQLDTLTTPDTQEEPAPAAPPDPVDETEDTEPDLIDPIETEEPLVETATEATDPGPIAETEGETQADATGPTGPAIGDILNDCDTCPPAQIVSLVEDGTGLAVALHETTIAEFRSFLTATGRPEGTGCFVQQTGTTSVWRYDSGAGYSAPGYPVTDAHPAVCVSYADATAFAAWVSAQSGASWRLPTGEEWRSIAGSTPDAGSSCNAGNFADQTLASEDVQLPAASCNDSSSFASPASGEALSGLYGNVAEWVDACQNGDCSRRLALGGSWAAGPSLFRSGLEETYSPNSRANTLGFRLIRVME